MIREGHLNKSNMSDDDDDDVSEKREKRSANVMDGGEIVQPISGPEVINRLVIATNRNGTLF